MAQSLPQTLNRQLQGFTGLPLQRQLGLIGGLALVAALAVTLLTWGMRPQYQVLLPGMSDQDKSAAIASLTRAGIEHRLDPASGLLTVPGPRMHEARLQLATDGLPKADGVGFELLDRDTGIGTSQMAETARFQRALEGELARSVATLNSVQSARVHLALPRRTVFLRDRASPSASVLVDLHPGRNLDEVQIAGIVHLVASSVPELDPQRVTVVDQRGRLLSQPEDAVGSGTPVRQLEYARQLESSIRQRVLDILAPVVGEQGVRVQVAAEVDFTQVESTREVFDGDNRALRSEQLAQEERRSGATGGVPGALTNQPPGAATVAAAVPAAAGSTEAEAVAATPLDRNSRSTRNYEIDRTIEHVRQAPASLSRLSVAVVVDDREVVGADGARVREPRPADEIDYLSGLVREAIGYNEARGDRVTLVNASFRQAESLPESEPLPIWQQEWFQPQVKRVLAAVGVLLLMLLVLRPALKGLAQAPAGTPRLAAAGAAGQLQDDRVQVGGMSGPSPQERLGQVRTLAKEDPRVVAQVVKEWMGKDE
ncbi:MAG: flagellar basal-body MS-ring/collar protein FliF [Pseudomonadales bacterium]